MKNLKRTIAAVTAVLICTAMLGSCAEKNETAETTTTEVTTAATEITEVTVDNSVDPSVPFDISAGVTDKMYGRALLSEGNTARLADVMKRAENGEEITVGVIGGSITQGSSARSYENCYASRFFNWWTEKFPSAKINTVNAGIGGTDSYLGVHRVDEQLLDKNPDVVIVEFSVNDTDKTMNKYSYDSLVRKILSCETNPAVILLFTTQENGTSLQDVHKEIGAAYDLPMISYREAVYPEVAAGTLNWKDISPDNIHPNDEGHGIIGQLLSRYLNSVYDAKDSAEAPAAFDTPGYTNDYYTNATILDASEITAVSSENFEIANNSLYAQFPNNWVTTAGGSLTFETECRNLGIFYLRTTDGKSGNYEVFVDGERKVILEGDFSGGWGNHGAPKQAVLSKDTVKHTIEIKPAAGSEDKGITILGIMVS